MALIRGVSSLHPCPRCVIAAEKQGDLRQTAALRTTASMKAVLLTARAKSTAGEKEKILKEVGLREVEVCPVGSFVTILYGY